MLQEVTSKISTIYVKKQSVTNVTVVTTFFAPNRKGENFDFEEGKGLPDHVHNGYASIFIYEGKVQISFESGEKFELNKGGYLAFDARVKHNVIAEIQSKVLVTISESLK